MLVAFIISCWLALFPVNIFRAASLNLNKLLQNSNIITNAVSVTQSKRAKREREPQSDGLALLSPLGIWVKCVHSTFNTISKWRTHTHTRSLLCSRFIMRVLSLSLCGFGGICLNKIDNFYFAVKSARQAKCCNTETHTHTHTHTQLKFRSRLVIELNERTSCGFRLSFVCASCSPWLSFGC